MDRKTRKYEIIKAAAVLFREKGYTGASMRDLAERVGIEPSSLYSHIRSKEEILITICFDCADQFSDGLHQISALEVSPLEKLKNLVNFHIDMAILEPISTTVFSDEWVHLPEEELQKFKTIRSEYEAQIKNIIQQGIDQQSIKPLSKEILFKTIISSVRWIYYRRKQYTAGEIAEVKSSISTILFEGLST